MTPARPTRLEPASEIVRQAHVGAYATLVLSGAYEEAGDAGRFKVAAGDVLIHAAFSAHRDIVARANTLVLDLPLPFDARDWPARATLRRPEMILAAAWGLAYVWLMEKSDSLLAPTIAHGLSDMVEVGAVIALAAAMPV